jgi:hypothetical protein
MARLQPEDLLSPSGPIDPAVLFPGESDDDVRERLAGYIADAYAQADVAALDAAHQRTPARHWAASRAYGDVYLRLAATPATASLPEQGGYTILASQIAAFKAFRDESLLAYERAVAAATGGEANLAAPDAARRTGGVPSTFRWV